jgi:hypothetical protein
MAREMNEKCAEAYEVDTWIELTALSDKLAMKLIVNFMSGTASKFFMDHVATNLKQWTIKDVYKALFDYCFPTDFKLRLRKRLMSAYQGKKTVRDFIRDIRSLAKRFPDVTERHLVQIFWDGADQYIRVKWLDRGMSPEESSLEKLVKWECDSRNRRKHLTRNNGIGDPSQKDAPGGDSKIGLEETSLGRHRMITTRRHRTQAPAERLINLRRIINRPENGRRTNRRKGPANPRLLNRSGLRKKWIR